MVYTKVEEIRTVRIRHRFRGKVHKSVLYGFCTNFEVKSTELIAACTTVDWHKFRGGVWHEFRGRKISSEGSNFEAKN